MSLLAERPYLQVVYTRLLRLLYKLQVQMWRLIRKHDPQPYEESVLGFLEPRLRMLSRVSLLTLAILVVLMRVLQLLYVYTSTMDEVSALFCFGQQCFSFTHPYVRQ